MDFWWSIPHWETRIGHFVAKLLATSSSVSFLMKWGCWGHWGRWGHWGCRSFKAWKTTTEDFRAIKAFEFSFIFMFWKNIFWIESWNIILNFSTFSVRGRWGQWMLIFWKPRMDIKNLSSQDFKTTFKQDFTYIFQSVRANS